MPNIIFASNNVAHFPGATTSSDTAHHDTSRVPYAISLRNYQEVASPVFHPVVGEETWFNFRFWTPNLDYNRSDRWFAAFDADGNTLFRIQKRNATSSFFPEMFLYDGDTTLSATSNIALVQQLPNNISIRYRVSSLIIECELFINGSSAILLTFNSNPNNRGNPVRFNLATGFTDNFGDQSHFSEIIVADGDTRNARLNLLRPAAAGAFEEWDGALAVLADDDTTTGLTTIDADRRHTMSMTPYTGASNISNVVAMSSTTRGQNSPTNIQHTVRLAGVDYDGVLHPVDFPLEYHLTDYKINPATSLPWTAADLTAIETGFVSRA